MSKEAMKLALEVLSSSWRTEEEKSALKEKQIQAIIALRGALAEQPAQRTWVGLTDEEVWDLWNSYTEEPFPEWFVDFKRAYKVLEVKLKEKNT